MGYPGCSLAPEMASAMPAVDWRCSSSHRRPPHKSSCYPGTSPRETPTNTPTPTPESWPLSKIPLHQILTFVTFTLHRFFEMPRFSRLLCALNLLPRIMLRPPVFLDVAALHASCNSHVSKSCVCNEPVECAMVCTTLSQRVFSGRGPSTRWLFGHHPYVTRDEARDCSFSLGTCGPDRRCGIRDGSADYSRKRERSPTRAPGRSLPHARCGESRKNSSRPLPPFRDAFASGFRPG